ncbi:MAG: aminotransferase class IV [Solirubrobacteraceae bacterium]
MAAELASVDGAIVPVASASVPVTDDGLLRGDGVFEVIRLYDGVPFALERHLERIAGSAANLRLALDLPALTDDVAALLGAAQPKDALLRLLATRGGRRIALIEPLPSRPGALSLGTVTYAPTRVLDGVKSLSYAANMLASRLASERGFDEALLVSPHGRVLELPTASLFWAKEGELYTPPLSDHILDSITRSIAIECSGARERVTTLEDLEAADEAFVASTVVEVRAVRRVEGCELSTDGPLTRTAAAGVRSAIASSLPH